MCSKDFVDSCLIVLCLPLKGWKKFQYGAGICYNRSGYTWPSSVEVNVTTPTAINIRSSTASSGINISSSTASSSINIKAAIPSPSVVNTSAIAFSVNIHSTTT
ncbi:predicted protein [Chaetomium globosum CBS 148.51]|uniref:Uncharacterized protein n=1 Tax=Chaetomium globosum (strain ATCC 6205 / CBS 148.51 / DSM 1962 / NBRC 6347 / NRRL 1970) TaxID=306901 RepID=Q2H7C5_CHAGB|nr:uncharacterized protein CHGG_05440 [Chaetomium globosum CBS 148.51]EAQ88821.1 predicted protein [Chaetomium globosum CBS 148.51]